MINLKDSQILDFTGQTIISPIDRLKKFIFSSYPVVKIEKMIDTEGLEKLAMEYASDSDMIWVVRKEANIRSDFPWHYRPSDIGRNFVHAFPKAVKRTGRPVAWNDIKLVPTGGVVHGELHNNIISSYHEADFDIYMISYHEAEADSNFNRLLQKFPDAKHIKNIEGIANAHREIGKQATTEMVYVVDADADVMNDFKFDYIPPMSKRGNTTYCWRARNPINDLEYGYGAIKLFPRNQLLEMGHELPDFSTGAAFFQPVTQVSNITRFNKDPFRTWRSAFRESVKLASNVNPNSPVDETKERLDVWCTVDNGERFGRYCIKGAVEGRAYGENNKDDIEALNKINDFEWLREQFVLSMKKKIRL